jgi:hypothetical protein
MLDRLLAPPDFPLAEQHAAAVTTLGLALWYSPALPISPMIAAVGLAWAYSASKYVALRRAASPGNVSGRVASCLNGLLRLLPLMQLLLMRELYFKVGRDGENDPSSSCVYFAFNNIGKIECAPWD